MTTRQDLGHQNVSTIPNRDPGWLPVTTETHANDVRVSQFSALESMSSQTPAQWADTLATAVTQKHKPKPLNLEEFLDNVKPPMLTEADMERFARKPADRITEADTRAFADQLEQYLLHDQTNNNRVEEGRALRKLIQYMSWKTLAQWLQLYANPSYTFTFPKREFWRKKFDENAHRCLPQPRHVPDITDSLDRLAKGLEQRLEKTDASNNKQSNNATNNNRNRSFNTNNQLRNNGNSNGQHNQGAPRNGNNFNNNYTPSQSRFTNDRDRDNQNQTTNSRPPYNPSSNNQYRNNNNQDRSGNNSTPFRNERTDNRPSNNYPPRNNNYEHTQNTKNNTTNAIQSDIQQILDEDEEVPSLSDLLPQFDGQDFP